MVTNKKKVEKNIIIFEDSLRNNFTFAQEY